MSGSFDFLMENMPSDLDQAIKFVTDDYDDFFENGSDPTMSFDIILQYFLIIYALLEETPNINLNSEYPKVSMLSFGANITAELNAMMQAINTIKVINNKITTTKNAHKMLNETKAKLGKSFAYHFDEKEVEDIQRLINDLRTQITTQKFFDEKHQQRILIRLEALQREIHKKMSDLDRFWGLIGDAGVALGKFGNDAQPFAKIIKDLTGVVWKAQARMEQIEPTNSLPLLPNQSNEAA